MLDRLDQARIARFCACFPQLFRPIDVLLLDRQMILYARKAALVDRILEDWDLILHFAWLHTGRTVATLYYWGEDIVVAKYDPNSGEAVSSKTTVVENFPMTSATLEKPPTTEANSAPVSTPDLGFVDINTIAARIAAHTGKDVEIVRAEILSLNPELYVKQDAAVMVVDRQIKELQQMRDSLASGIAPVMVPQNGKTPAKTSRAKSATPAKRSTSSRTTKSPSSSKKR